MGYPFWGILSFFRLGAYGADHAQDLSLPCEIARAGSPQVTTTTTLEAIQVGTTLARCVVAPARCVVSGGKRE